MRLDIYLFENKLAKSRSFAKELVEGGYVMLDGKTVTKPAAEVASQTVEVVGKPYDYVSRGGLKLEAALDAFGVSVVGMVCADIGASSGGFTDCLLRRGAAKVYAVDSGHDQLDEKLSADKRVINIEGLNARSMTLSDVGGECPDMCVCDVSFISQTLIIPAVSQLLTIGSIYIALIKPQFECGRAALSKGGIVRDRREMQRACETVIAAAAKSRLGCTGLIKSPVTGGDGNTEFLMICKKDIPCEIDRNTIKEVCRT